MANVTIAIAGQAVKVVSFSGTANDYADEHFPSNLTPVVNGGSKSTDSPLRDGDVITAAKIVDNGARVTVAIAGQPVVTVSVDTVEDIDLPRNVTPIVNGGSKSTSDPLSDGDVITGAKTVDNGR